MESQRPKWLSLDTDLMVRMGQGEEGVHLFRELALERGETLYAAPRALKELEDLETMGKSPDVRLGASAARHKMPAWNIRPLAVGDASTARRAASLADYLRQRGWLPEPEIGDSHILAQASLADIRILVAIDGHYPTDNQALARSLQAWGAPVVAVFHPQTLARRWLGR